MNTLAMETIRVMVLTTIAFVVALLVTPFWYRVIKKHHFDKQIRDEGSAPIFHELHKKKVGTPTGGGLSSGPP